MYLIGGNGAPNYGDELIVKSWIDYLSRRFPGERMVLDCNNASIAEGFFEHARDYLSVISGVKTFTNKTVRPRVAHIKNGADRFLESVRIGLQFFEAREWQSSPYLAKVIDALGKSRTLHILGGGYINSGIRPDSGFLIGFAAAARRALGIRVFATGLGITPFGIERSKQAAGLIAALEEFSVFECRDAYGFDRLYALTEGTSLVNGVDDTFMLRPEAKEDGVSRLHLCFLRTDVREAYPGMLRNIGRLSADFDEVTYWNCVPRMADDNISWVKKEIPRVTLLDCRELVYDPIPVSPNDLMITQRFHPHLISARIGCDGYFVQDGKYYFDKHHSVVHLGSTFRKYADGSPLGRGRGEGGLMRHRDRESMHRKAVVRDLCYGDGSASGERP